MHTIPKNCAGPQAQFHDLTGLRLRNWKKLAGPDAILHHITFDFQLPASLPPIRGQHVQLQQVFLHLIRNGIQAMPECPTTGRQDAVTVVAREGGVAEFAVTDAGTGVPPEKLEEMLAPFRSTKPSGLGMGLAICRRISNAHSGRIWIENNAGPGATVRFTLPACRRLRAFAGAFGPKTRDIPAQGTALGPRSGGDSPERAAPAMAQICSALSGLTPISSLPRALPRAGIGGGFWPKRSGIPQAQHTLQPIRIGRRGAAGRDLCPKGQYPHRHAREPPDHRPSRRRREPHAKPAGLLERTRAQPSRVEDERTFRAAAQRRREGRAGRRGRRSRRSSWSRPAG